MNSRVLLIVLGGLALVGIIVLVVMLLHKPSPDPTPGPMTLHAGVCPKTYHTGKGGCNDSSMIVMGYVSSSSSSPLAGLGKLDSDVAPSWLDTHHRVTVDQLIYTSESNDAMSGSVKVVLSSYDEANSVGHKVKMTVAGTAKTKTYVLSLAGGPQCCCGCYTASYSWDDVSFWQPDKSSGKSVPVRVTFQKA